MRTAAIYARVSTVLQKEEGTSLDTQVEACQKYAVENDMLVVETISEARSGKNLDRPGLYRAIELVKQSVIEALIVYDVDRFSRDLGDQLVATREIERLGGQIFYVGTPPDPTFILLKSVVAQIERGNIADRFRRGKRECSARGKVMGSGHSPYGYKYIKGGGSFEVITSELEYVKKMYEWLVGEGLSIGKIAKRLDQMQVPTKRGAAHWARATVYEILQNPLYIGEYYWCKTDKNDGKKRVDRPQEDWVRVPAPGVDPIVDRTTWDAVQDRLKINRELSSRGTKFEYLLRGMLVCSHCGYHITSSVTGNGKRKYRCGGRYQQQLHLPKEQRCTTGYFDAEKLEDAIWAEVARQVSNPDVIETTIRAQMEAQNSGVLKARACDLTREEASLTERADRYVDLLVDGGMDRDTYDRKMLVTRQALESIRNTLAETRRLLDDQERVLDNLEALKKMCRKLSARLPLAKFAEKRQFLEALNLHVVINNHVAQVSGLLQEVMLPVPGAPDDLCKVSEQASASPT